MPGSGGSERTLMKRICLFPAYTVLAAFVAAIAFSGCQNINVDTERLLPPVVSNGRTDGRFVIGTSDTVTITDPNDGAVIKYTVDGGPEQTYSAPIGLTDDATIAAWAIKAGLTDSTTTTKSFTLAWRTLIVELPEPRYSHAVAATDDAFWIVGGFNSTTTPLDSVLKFVPGEGLSVETLLPEARRGHSLAVYGGDLYVLGGFANTTSEKALRLDLPDQTGGWTYLTGDFEMRVNSQAALVNGVVYMPFGYGASDELSTWGRYSLSGGAQPGALAPSYLKRQFSGSSALDGVVYAIGGGGAAIAHDVYRYDVDAAEWLTAETLPDTGARYAQGSVVTLDSRIYVFSFNNAYIRSTTGAWALDGLPSPRPVHNAGAAALGGKIYVFGGSSLDGVTKYESILEFTPP